MGEWEGEGERKGNISLIAEERFGSEITGGGAKCEIVKTGGKGGK